MKNSEFRMKSAGEEERFDQIFILHSSFFIHTKRAFTLIELMVVVAIIALLVAVLLPALSTVRSKAKYAQTNSQFNSLNVGLETFRGEQALGGTYPPSASDNKDDRWKIANPRQSLPGAKAQVWVNGAHLLVHAMLGADLLGVPGFRDFGTGPGKNGLWWDDTHDSGSKSDAGAYALCKDVGEGCTTPGQPLRTRYGGAGYVDEKMSQRAESLEEMFNEGRIVAGLGYEEAKSNGTETQPLFNDPWDHPILYYRANPAALAMIRTSDNRPGVYDQEDNGLITGSLLGYGGKNNMGINFGAGKIGNTRPEDDVLHGLARALEAKPNPAESPLNDVTFDNTFARFIWDQSKKARNEPVRKDSYLLISAGADGRYGTEDDVTNWQKE